MSYLRQVNLNSNLTDIVDLYFSKDVQTLTLTSGVSIGDTTCTVTAGTGEPVNGNAICLREGSAFYQGLIVSHSADGGNWTVTIDTPFDYAFTTSANGYEEMENMNVNGSVTPQIFSINMTGLAAGEMWEITRILIAITDDAAMDDSKFGGITALTKGLVLRLKYNGYKNIFNVKSNADFALRAYDVNYADNAPAGEYGLRVRRTFNGQDKNDTAMLLTKDSGDELQIVIQDNLTALTTFKAVAQGRRVTR